MLKKQLLKLISTAAFNVSFCLLQIDIFLANLYFYKTYGKIKKKKI